MAFENKFWEDQQLYMQELLDSDEITREEHAFMVGYYSYEYVDEERSEE